MVVRNKNLVIWLSIVAGLQALVASTGLAEVLPDRYVGLLTAVVAALNAGTAAYVAGGRPLSDSTSSHRVVDTGGDGTVESPS